MVGGFAGIKLSRFTKEAPVGPRKASGVRHVRGLGAARLSPRRDRSNSSGLPSSRPFTFTWPPSMASSNRSPSNSRKKWLLTLQVYGMHRTTLGTVIKESICLPEGLAARGEGPLRAVFSDGTENGSTPEEAINTPKCDVIYLLWNMHLRLSCMSTCMHTDAPVLAGRAHSRPAALSVETLFCGASQGSTGGSHGGGGLLEDGGATQGGSALEVLVLPSLGTERWMTESLLQHESTTNCADFYRFLIVQYFISEKNTWNESGYKSFCPQKTNILWL